MENGSNIKNNYNKKCRASGITLIALVVTIVVMLVLAGVSISLLTGDNGVISKSKETKITAMLSSYVEQYELFITAKKMENSEFYEESLTAGKNSIYYNTKTSNSEKSIKDIINGISDEYLEKLEIIKGKMIINTQDRQLIKIAQKVGIEPNPYVIENGELMSNDGNLLLVDENGTLTLPGSVTKIGTGAFSNVDGLKTIIIPGTVKTIGKNAFRNNSTLESVIIEDGVETIEESAFDSCRNLKEVSLPDSIKTMGSRVFTSCTRLTKIEIPKDIEDINVMLFSMSGLTDIKLRGDKVKKIYSEAFFGCKIENFHITKDISYIEANAFDHCTNLSMTVDEKNNNFIYVNGMLLPKAKDKVLFVSNEYYKEKTTFEIPANVENFECNLGELTNITTLVIPASTKSLNARNLPTSLLNVQISDANETFKTNENCIYTKTEPETLIFCYSKDTDINLKEPANKIGDFCFRGAKNAVKITLNDKTESIGSQVFNSCYKLRDVIMGKNLNNISHMFAYKMYNVNFTLDSQNENYCIEDGLLYNKSKDKLITVLYCIDGKFTVPDSVKTIGKEAFYSQQSITNIELNNVETIESQVFTGCSKLLNIDVPSTVKSIDTNGFANAISTSKIVIHKKENSISGSPFGSPFGLRAIEWKE